MEEYYCKPNEGRRRDKMDKVIIEYGRNDVREVKSTWDETEANELIAHGWIVMHAGLAHKDVMGFQAKPCYILARIGTQ